MHLPFWNRKLRGFRGQLSLPCSTHWTCLYCWTKFLLFPKVQIRRLLWCRSPLRSYWTLFLSNKPVFPHPPVCLYPLTTQGRTWSSCKGSIPAPSYHQMSQRRHNHAEQPRQNFRTLWRPSATTRSAHCALLCCDTKAIRLSTGNSKNITTKKC